MVRRRKTLAPEPLTSFVLGDRLRAIRESLDNAGGSGPHVSASAICRLFAPPDVNGEPQRHHWRKWEQIQTPDATTLADVDHALIQVAHALEVAHPEKVAEQLSEFVRGDRATLPWSGTPAWKAGKSPVQPMGRPSGSRVVVADSGIRVLPPGERPERSRLAAQAAAAPVFTSAAVPRTLTITPSLAPVYLAILRQIKAGQLEPEAALSAMQALSLGPGS